MRIQKLPEVNEQPKNQEAAIECEGYMVSSYTPGKDGIGPLTEVHFCIEVQGLEFILAMKSRRACDELIAALQRHANDVFPLSEKQS